MDVDMALEVEIDKGMAKREGLDITSVDLAYRNDHMLIFFHQIQKDPGRGLDLSRIVWIWTHEFRQTVLLPQREAIRGDKGELP